MRLVRKVATTDAASKFKSMQANARVIKNYRHKLLDTITASIKQAFENHYNEYQYDLLGYIDTLGWIYKDIIRVKDDVEPLFPEDYELTPYMVKAYHKCLNDTLRKIVDSAPEAKVLLELHAWIKEYRVSMKELEIPSAWLQPALLDGKSQDLIEDYVKLIVTKLDEWTVNLMKQETSKFQWRTSEPEQGQDGQFGMEGVVDFFQLVNQQCDLALDSNQGAVLARVVTESAKVMRRTQQEWLKVVAEECRYQVEKKPEEVPGGLVEYVIALANDQLKSADYAEALSARLEPLVSAKYKEVISGCLNEAIDGYLDVAKRCTSSLVDFVFNDLRTATKNLITPAWYTDNLMAQIIETMRDYMSDYQAHLNPSIFDILVEDLLDAFLIAYLTALRRSSARSLRMPAAVTRIQTDISSAFDFFTTYKPPEDLEGNFEVIDQIVSMLGASSQMVFMDYWTFAKKHGPQLQFVEALMKARDDFDRVVVGEIMDTLRRKVREENIEEPPEPTIMVSDLCQLPQARLTRRSRSRADRPVCCRICRRYRISRDCASEQATMRRRSGRCERDCNTITSHSCNAITSICIFIHDVHFCHDELRLSCLDRSQEHSRRLIHILHLRAEVQAEPKRLRQHLHHLRGKVVVIQSALSAHMSPCVVYPLPISILGALARVGGQPVLLHNLRGHIGQVALARNDEDVRPVGEGLDVGRVDLFADEVDHGLSGAGDLISRGQVEEIDKVLVEIAGDLGPVDSGVFVLYRVEELVERAGGGVFRGEAVFCAGGRVFGQQGAKHRAGVSQGSPHENQMCTGSIGQHDRSARKTFRDGSTLHASAKLTFARERIAHRSRIACHRS